MKHLDVAVAVVFRDSRILIARRKAGGDLGGYWEFPGGKLEAGETLETCVRRELWEELGMRVQPVMSFTPFSHRYADREICLHAFLCTHESGEPQLLECDEIRWVSVTQLRLYEFPAANRPLINELVSSLPEPADAVPVSVTIPAANKRRSKRPRQPAAV
jgi:mutator protein MutT